MKKVTYIVSWIVAILLLLVFLGTGCLFVLGLGLGGLFISEVPDSVWVEGFAPVILDGLSKKVVSEFERTCEVPAAMPATGDPAASCGGAEAPVDYSGWKIKYLEHDTSTLVYSGTYDKEGNLLLKASWYPVCDGELSELVLKLSFNTETCVATSIVPPSNP